MRGTVLGFSLCAPAVVAFFGCAGSNSSNTILPNSAVTIGLPVATKSPVVMQRADYDGLRDLYVLDSFDGAVDLFRNKTYREIGAITNGLSAPSAVFLDTRGNLYVANPGNATITEYPPKATSPSFTYSNGMQNPVGVAADDHGNVYDADYSGRVILQYFQGVNRYVRGCTPRGGYVRSVAVDSSNDVFISFLAQPSGPAELAEFPGGLSGCAMTLIGPTFIKPPQITVDKSNDLLVADELNNTIDVLAPPYVNVTRTFGSGTLISPLSVTLNRDNRLAFVADESLGAVVVFDYRTGAVVTELGGPYGLSKPISAVDGPNAVY